MTAKELRQKYLDFFKSKGHIIIPSASLIPENDPTVLFTTAGMQPLVPYLMGEDHPAGDKIVNVQKCIRTGDINEVGDKKHHTFFEMMGNWSFGDFVSADGISKTGYFKEEAIEMSWKFLTSIKYLGLDKNRLAVSVFEGDENSPFDEISYKKWLELGVSEKRIARLSKKQNWWGPAGETGPCGPDTEIFYWIGNPNKVPENFNDDDYRWVEIWNNVFMEYEKTKNGKFISLKQKNVDTGMGLERMLVVMNELDDNYKTELFLPIIEKIEKLSGKKYDNESEVIKKAIRIVADHIKASVFIVADEVEPSNTERGYVVRRLIRRAIRYGRQLEIKKENNWTTELAKIVINIYKETYDELEKNQKFILGEMQKEEEKFGKTLEKGLKRFMIYDLRFKNNNESVKGEEIFDLYQTYGFPFEMSVEELKKIGINFNEEKLKKEFDDESKKHQELSRTASVGMFKGGLADVKKETTQLHSATHLMLAGLREILGEHIHQKGSNINGERIRFDFSYGEKMTDEQIKKVENFVNEAIESKVAVVMTEMTLEDAKKSGAEGAFENKYGDKVKVYKMGKFSNEICGGPHIKNTSELGRFKIQKEKSSGAGVRRIKAVLVS